MEQLQLLRRAAERPAVFFLKTSIDRPRFPVHGWRDVVPGPGLADDRPRDRN
jgi:hypothetical protein